MVRTVNTKDWSYCTYLIPPTQFIVKEKKNSFNFCIFQNLVCWYFCLKHYFERKWKYFFEIKEFTISKIFPRRQSAECRKVSIYLRSKLKAYLWLTRLVYLAGTQTKPDWYSFRNNIKNNAVRSILANWYLTSFYPCTLRSRWRKKPVYSIFSWPDDSRVRSGRSPGA